MTFLGIDPGMSGALVFYSPESNPRTYLMSLKDRTQPIEPYQWLAKVKRYKPKTFAVLEMIPKSIFGTDKATMSVLYGSYRELRMALIVLDFEFHEAPVARPTETWVREFFTPRKQGETNSEWKERHAAAARAIYKDASITPETSDAFLLAEYARRMKAGTLTHAFKAEPKQRKRRK